MRYLYPLLLCLSITSTAFSQSQKGFTVKGKISGLQTGTVYLLYKDDDGKSHQQEATIANGQFEFTGKVSEARHCYLYTTGQVKPGEFFIENANIAVSFDSKTPENLKVKGSPATDLYLAFRNKESDVLNEYAALEGMYFNALQKDDKAMLHGADSLKVAVNAKHREYLKGFCAANPKSPVSEYLVTRAMEFDHDFASIAKIFALLDGSLTGNYSGKLIASKLGELKDVATDKADADISVR